MGPFKKDVRKILPIFDTPSPRCPHPKGKICIVSLIVKLKIIKTVFIYTFRSHDFHRDRAIKYLNFEPNVDVVFCLIPSPPCLHVSDSS